MITACVVVLALLFAIVIAAAIYHGCEDYDPACSCPYDCRLHDGKWLKADRSDTKDRT